jgi:hypothetical protein
MALASIISPDTGNITIYTDLNCFNVTNTHPNYKKIVEALKAKDEKALNTLCDVPKALQQFTRGLVEIKDGVIFFRGQELHNIVTQRILDFMNKGLPFEPLVLFLERLMKNPSYKVVQDLYSFLEKNGLPITERGTFLSYKALNANFTDIHTGKVDNRPGAVIPRFERNQVEDNPNVHCGKGYHSGTFQYSRSFGSRPDCKFVMTEIAPEDVISVPYDLHEKIRVTWYQVVKEVPREEAIQGSLYNTAGDRLDSDESPLEDWEDFDDAYNQGYEDAQSEMRDLLGS